MRPDCPNDQNLAAYIDGRLTPASRESIAGHLLECGECYFVFLETVKLKRHEEGVKLEAAATARRRKLLEAVAAVPLAAALAIAVLAPLGLWQQTTNGARDALSQAQGERRFVEGRLGGLAWRPMASPTRSIAETSRDTDRWGLFAAAAVVQERTRDERTAATLADYGVAHLLLGNADEAIDTLREATRLAPDRATIWNDLAAAWLERGRVSGHADDLPHGLEAAGRALALQPGLPEALYNRALLLEALGLTAEARKAWESYLERDPDSPWAVEARQRLQTMAAPDLGALWPQARQEILAAAPGGRSTRLDDLVRRYAGAVRFLVQEEVFADWGDAVLLGDEEEAATRLATAGTLAALVAEASGDPLLTEAVEIARGANGARRAQLARSHHDYRRGRKAFERFDLDAAAESLGRAHAGFAATDSPFAGWSAYFLEAIAHYREGASVARLLTLDRYPILAARARTLAGVEVFRDGDLAEAITLQSGAVEAFREASDADETLRARYLLAEALWWSGRHDDAWRHVVAASRLAGAAVDPTRPWLLYLYASQFAGEAEMPHLALAYLDAAVAASSSFATEIDRVGTQIRRARAFIELARPDLARRELAVATATAAAIPDSDLREPLESDIDTVLARALLAESPQAAIAAIDRSRRRALTPHEMPELLAVRARAAAEMERPREAERDLLAAIAETERLREPLDVRSRITFADSRHRVFEAMVALQLDHLASPERALDFAEAGRGRSLAEALVEGPCDAGDLPAWSLRSLIASLPPGMAALFVERLDDRLLTWWVDAAGATVGQAPATITASDLRRLTETLGRRGEAEAVLGRLYAEILGPHRERLARVEHLVIVPDGELAGVPFPALLDRGNGRYLIEDVALSIAPSGRMLVALLAAGSERRGASRSLVALADPESAGAPLPAARREARVAARHYPDARVFVGAAADRLALLEQGPTAAVLHFAGHTDPGSALLSPRLVLGRERSADVTPADLSGTCFAATRAVVLASCSGADGVGSPSEGNQSLARAFLASGVPSVIATLWPVEDGALPEMMDGLHRRLAAGRPPAAALREAQVEQLRRDGSRIADWGGFETYGL